MTYQQYWEEDCQLVKYYKEAFEIQQRRMNEQLWLQGMYVYDAVCAVSPVLHAFAKSGTKPIPYHDKPFPMSKAEAEERQKAEMQEKLLEAKRQFAAWASKLKLPEKREGESKDG